MAGRNIQDSTLTRRPEPRVNSFAIDPLHSAAYLRNLITYLNGSRQRRSGGNNRPSASPDRENAFLYCYRIPDTSTRNTSNPVLIGSPTIYTTSDAFISSRPNADCSEIVFATGYPSREWLAALLDHLGVDYRFLHSHLNFLQSAQRDWFVSPSVPSRRQHQIGLVIPSIIFLGTETRRIPAQDLHEARNSCAKQLQQQAKLFSGASSIRHGRSIIRHINIHSGDMMVLEQAVTITVTKNDRNVKGMFQFPAPLLKLT